MLSGDFSLGSPIFARKRYFCENFGVFRLSDVFSTRFSFRQRLFGVFSGKRQSEPTRNVKTKKAEGYGNVGSFYRPIFVFCSDLRPARFDLLPPRKLSPISPFSVGFYEPSQAPCPKVGAESSLSAFYAVLRVFTLPLKKIFLIPLSNFDLSCFRRRTESFLFKRSVFAFEDDSDDLLSHTRHPADAQRRARRFKPLYLPYNAFLRPARFSPLQKVFPTDFTPFSAP